MATSAGPNLEGVKSNNLSLAFDVHDAKSYPGEPTMNMIQLPNNLTNTGNWNVVSGTAANNQTEGPNGRQAGSLTASNSDPYIYSSYIFTVATGNLTFSAYVKGAGATVGMGGDIRINFGTSAGQATGSNTTSTYTITADWQRVSVTASVTGAGTIKVGIEAPNSATSGQVVYIADIQLEQKAKATPFVVGPNPNDDGTYMGRPATVDFMLHGNVGTGTTFSDSGKDALTITNANSVAHSAVSKFNGESIKFVRASSQQLTTASTSNINFGTGDWTIDFWFNITNGSVDRMHALNVGTGNTSQISFNFNDSYAFWLYWNGTGGNNILFGSDGDYGDGQWHHLAATRYNGMVRVWVDGVHKGSNNYNSSTSMGQTASLYIGSASGGQYWDGYLDEVRVAKGTALWKGGNDFVPPTRRGAGGPLIDRSQNLNDATLLNGAGIQATGPSTRRDGQVIIPVADTYIDIDGTDDQIAIANSTTYNNALSKTVELWVRAETGVAGAFNVIYTNRLSSDIAINFALYLDDRKVVRTWNPSGNDEMVLSYQITNGSATFEAFSKEKLGTTTGDNLWHCVVGVTDIASSKIFLYYDGEYVHEKAFTGTPVVPAANLRLGSGYGGPTSTDYGFSGQYGTFRIYGEALTAAQIKQNFNQQRNRFGA